MYNRYIPQPDGSYRCNRIPDPTHTHARQKPQAQSAKKEAPIEHPQDLCLPPKKEPRRYHKKQPQETSITSFFKNLIPQGMDTGDLLVIILLLLMAGDCQDEQNHALLTMMLYLFL